MSRVFNGTGQLTVPLSSAITQYGIELFGWGYLTTAVINDHCAINIGDDANNSFVRAGTNSTDRAIRAAHRITSGSPATAVSATELTINTWTAMGARFDGSASRFAHIGGTLGTENTSTVGTPITGLDVLTIGLERGGDQDGWIGRLAHVAGWVPGTLSAQDRTDLANGANPSTINVANLLFYDSLNRGVESDGTGNSVMMVGGLTLVDEDDDIGFSTDNPPVDQIIPVGILTDTDTINAITPVQSLTVAVGLLTETDTINPVTTGVNAMVGLLAETDTINAITPVVSPIVPVGLLIETDTIDLLRQDVLFSTIDNFTPDAAVGTFTGISDDCSGATYRQETNEFITVINNGSNAVVYDIDVYNVVVKTIALTMNGIDSEAIVDMGNGEFAVGSESSGRYQIDIFDWPAGTAASSKQELIIFPVASETNFSIEGLCYDKDNQFFYAVGEGEHVNVDRYFFKVVRPTNTTTDYDVNIPADVPFLTVTQPFNAETAFASLGTGAEWDLSGCCFDHVSGNVVIVSHTGNEAAQVDVVTGAIIATMPIAGMSQIEGVTIMPDSRLMVTSEPNNYRLFISSVNSAIGLLTETDTINSVTPVLASGVPVGLLIETDTINAVTPALDQIVSIGLLIETDTILSVSSLINTPVGLLIETDTINAVTPALDQIVSIGLLIETDTINTVTPILGLGVVVGLLVETDAINIVTPTTSQVVSVGLLIETDTINIVTPLAAQIIPVGLLIETDTINPVTDPSANDEVAIYSFCVIDDTTIGTGIADDLGISNVAIN